ncbi:hypothetical protein [Burkholderia lata]|uniref:hypothetical protein n=1 Tax=Burkholderia lata (strain ATCC 17760 / DSM 23089 / LMG 22485 / NCIMB 9086 / R18194 / 383) TaxID=482957 RepID=UPI0015823A44|nr:hypothetical protein [Burkholderia lata]
MKIALADPDHFLIFSAAPAQLGLTAWLTPSIRLTLPSAAGAGNTLLADIANANERVPGQRERTQLVSFTPVIWIRSRSIDL